MKLADDWKFRGLAFQSTDPDLLDKLSAGGLTAYVGFDPTAPSLHIGNLLQLCNLRRLQLAGNRPIALAGGGTGLIGDPSFKDAERPLLDNDTLAENLAGITEQLGRFLDFSASAGSSRALVLDNAAWLTTISLTDFLRDVGKHFTVNQMIAKESVKSRLERTDVGISYTEFTYMLCQAYDFLRLSQDHGCDVQLGGSDQWGNITMGTELVRKVTGKTAYGLTSPLITKSDGTKFGKSEGGNERVWLDASRTSPFAFYQFFVNVDDDMTALLLRFLTFLDHDTISQLDIDTRERPAERLAQKALAKALVTLVHGDAAAQQALTASDALFSEEISSLDERTLLDATADAPRTTMARRDFDSGLPVVDLLVRCALASSKAEARRFVEQGGVYINNRRLDADVVTLDGAMHGRYLLVRRGRRHVHLVVAE